MYAWTHGNCIPLNQSISLIQGMSLPSQTITLEVSLLVFFFGSGSWAGDCETCSSNFLQQEVLQEDVEAQGLLWGMISVFFLPVHVSS